jgi:hypothetical protein
MKTSAQDFEDVFLSDPDYAEDVIYFVKGNLIGKLIPAVIFRNKFRQKQQYGNRGTQSQSFSYDIEIGISRGDLGMLSVTPGLDFVELPVNEGDIIRARFNVMSIVAQDRGYFRLGLKK